MPFAMLGKLICSRAYRVRYTEETCGGTMGLFKSSTWLPNLYWQPANRGKDGEDTLSLDIVVQVGIR